METGSQVQYRQKEIKRLRRKFFVDFSCNFLNVATFWMVFYIWCFGLHL